MVEDLSHNSTTPRSAIGRADESACRLTNTSEPISALGSPWNFSFDRRDQFSASAIQKTPLAGSRFASCLHRAARELNSAWLIIGSPCLRVELSQPEYDRCRSPDYCPDGQCPNGHVKITDLSGPAPAATLFSFGWAASRYQSRGQRPFLDRVFHFCRQMGLSASSSPRALASWTSASRAASQRSALVNSWVDTAAPFTAPPSQPTTIRT